MFWPLRLVAPLLLIAASAVGCGDETTFVNDDPPDDDDGGQGGFDPGPSPNAASNGAYGYGASSAESSSAVGSPTGTTVTTTGGGGGAGGAGEGGTGGEPPPECDEVDRRCEHTFSYENADVGSVEVRGDFAPGAWDDGVDMVNDGGTWTATVPLPWDTDVQYRFFLDGGEWITDPSNPDTIDDGFGGLNSLLAGQTCPDDFICEE